MAVLECANARRKSASGSGCAPRSSSIRWRRKAGWRSAGRGTAARLEAVLGPLDVSFTLRPGDATRWTRAAARNGFERFIVLGGDGSVNEVLNGLLTSGIDASSLTLWPMPAGTGNDSCRGLGVPLDPAEAIDRLGAGTRADRRHAHRAAGARRHAHTPWPDPGQLRRAGHGQPQRLDIALDEAAGQDRLLPRHAAGRWATPRARRASPSTTRPPRSAPCSAA